MQKVLRIGPRPLLLARLVWHRLSGRLRRAAVRASYSRTVIAPAGRAELRIAPIDLPAAADLPPALMPAAERIRAEADAILTGRCALLGWGELRVGDPVDWHADLRTGHRWPLAWHEDVRIAPGGGADPKLPWELSRGHHLLTLARAGRLFGERRYAQELERQLAGWLEANPAGHGINWTNPMEVGIRAVNWIWALGTVEPAFPLDPALRRRVADSLATHARHIRWNLEETPRLRGNHYLADLLGLIAIATALDGDPAAPRWERLARRGLEREVREQVLDDGCGFEASLPYHGLSLELLLAARIAAARAGRPLSERFDERLARMTSVARAVRHPGGRTPQIGDSDAGRVLPGGAGRPPSLDAVLWTASAALGLGRPLPGDPHDEVAWTLGLDAWSRAARAEPAADSSGAAASFPDGGFHVLVGGGTHLVVRCGGVGQRGVGGHAHNDLLSFELGRRDPVVVDPGTFAYTSDPAARNEFRSAAAHNTARVDGLESHPLPESELFELPEHARGTVELHDEQDGHVRLVASHDGFRTAPGGPVTHRREFRLDRATGSVTIGDELLGDGEHDAEWFLHLAPGTAVEEAEGGAFRLGADLTLALRPPAGCRVAVEEGWVSEVYGRRERGPVIVARGRTTLPARLTMVFDPAPVRPAAAPDRAPAEVRA